MKQLMKYLAVAGMVCAMHSGCKKADSVGTGTTGNNIPAAPKDTIVTGRTWWGGVILPGGVGQYFSVHFNADSTLQWSEMSGDYPGKWSLTKKRITIDVPVHNVKFSADITDENMFNNISGDNADFQVFTAERLRNEDVQISGTSWQGYISAQNERTRTPVTLQFTSESKVQIILNGQVSGPVLDCTSSAITRSFRVSFENTEIFGTFVTSSHIEGMQDNANFLLSADKM